MGLYDVIAAGQQGQCFALVARRFMISEPQAARAVRHLLPAILPPFEAWVETPAGLTLFLETLSKGGYERTLQSTGILNNHFERDRGLQLLSMFRAAREIDGADLARAAETSGLPYRVLLQMLPFVTLFLMAAWRGKLEQPLRDVLGRRVGAAARRSADPFADMAELVASETKGHRHGMLGTVLAGIFGHRSVSARPVAMDVTGSPA